MGKAVFTLKEGVGKLEMCGNVIPCYPGSCVILDEGAIQNGDVGTITGVWAKAEAGAGDPKALAAQCGALSQDLAKANALNADLMGRVTRLTAALEAGSIATPALDETPAKLEPDGLPAAQDDEPAKTGKAAKK